MRKLALFAGAFSAAIFLAVYLLPFGWRLPLAAVCIAAAFLPGKRRGRRLLLIGFCVGLLWSRGYDALTRIPAEQWDGRTETVDAVVLSYPEPTAYGIRQTVRLDLGPVGLRTILYADASDWEPGDRVTVTAKLTSSAYARGETVRYYHAKGIFLRAYLREAGPVEHGGGLRFLPARCSHALAEEIESVFGPGGPLVTALKLGQQTALSEFFLSALTRAGLRHTVAVSGMHLSFLVGFLLLLLPKRRWYTLLILTAVIFFFALMVGGRPSVIRAGVMQLFVLAAPVLGRDRDLPTGLTAALLLLLAANPYAAAHVGLQLSFTAVLGIALFSEPLFRFFSRCLPTGAVIQPFRFILKFIFSALATTLGAMVFTTPLTAYYFGTVSLISPLSNLLTLWAVSFLFCGGLCAGLLGLLWHPLGMAVAWPFRLLSGYLIHIIPALSRLNWAAVSASNVSIRSWLLFAYGMLALWLLARRLSPERRLCRPAVPAAACVAALFIALAFSAGPGTDLTVKVLDVGQGASTVLLSGDTSVVVDCGGDEAGTAAADCLQSAGMKQVDLLVLTHFHADHADGLPMLFDRLEIKAAAVPDVDDGLRGEFESLAAAEGTAVYWITEETRMRQGELDVTLYEPLGSGGGNEEGLCVLASCGDFDALITGDAGWVTEHMLVKYRTMPDIELLVAGHHGAEGSSSKELLETLRPEIAVISVGYNVYGHPAEETLARLTDAGVSVYRTDQCGDVTVRWQNGEA
ncbi:MAG: ComEC/Rec2 family competence protein [Oscillospiraceae bacterium]|nr:ComEC/Rec2 family competence protein [Oscillospiraceae bacterium]